MKETKYDDKRVIHKATRMALNKTQDWLANKIYVSASDISKYENAKKDGDLSDIYIERINKALSYEFERQVKDAHGEWYKNVLELKIAINIVEICKYNPKEQKKAYNNLLMPLLTKKNITPWIYIVKDPAFGDMELFDKEEKQDG